jgi:hypothetical protein
MALQWIHVPIQMADFRDKSKFGGNLFLWPVARVTRTFRVFVVEPKEYCPRAHHKIFNAAITALVTPETVTLDPFVQDVSIPRVEPFDLITFPEAFLPQDELVGALREISGLSSIGCVHVGLRPTADPQQHLFGVREIKTLIQSLSIIPRVDQSDLKVFSDWITKQIGNKKFNIGCLFMVDADQNLRICLHPKIVRSKFEVNPLHEKHMAEADLLSLVTLVPTDKTLKTVTLQPLICSDALHLDTDRPQFWPLESVNSNADSFGVSLPDHVDIVSLATCTPQQIQVSARGIQYRTWHQDFLSSFQRAASELPRHYYSTFVLSNFQMLPDDGVGGLSGAFIPVSLPRDPMPSFITVSSWGKFKNSANRWSTPDDNTGKGDGWSSLGYVASLDPMALNEAIPACMLGFTVHRFPRDATRWKSIEGLVDFQLRTATENSGDMVFERIEGQ